ncbi:MAG TPA: leucine-rich repeat domain-containing protein, partial [Clostridia bacterium]
PDYSEATNKRPALTFQGWNNSYTNITGNKDIGAIYIPTDGKTHAFVRLTVASGKNVSLYLNKTDTSTLSIDWGDNITTTHTNIGDFNTSHTYSDYGDYEIKIWISSGSGEYGFGNGNTNSVFVGGAQQTQRNMLMYLFIGNNVSSIRGSAFTNCYSLTSIVIPESVSSIGGSAFTNCYSLTDIVIPESVSSIGTNAFGYCYSLTSIVIPESVSSIESYAFQHCYSLTDIVIPESVSSISDYAFRICYSILKYVFNRTTPPTLASTSAFNNINSICKIYVPDESVEAYKTATNWVTYADYIYPISEMEGDN